ncbi:type 1 fimbrial protein [Paraburkholderia silviterrae]|uniref:Type 1 fimbrial protein n=2 Tax=Paraburkholderia silviterrae TaxID=2528715 RepID=A0A4R5M4T6_9BURK|nr:type 1 fimbrial protein [Paraburkholderia silviterrae]
MRSLQLLLGILVAILMGPVFAADANLNFTGTILQPSCDIDSSTANQTVPLGRAPIMDFAAVGSTSNPTAFNLKLVNCAPGTSVTMSVTGTMDTVPSVLKNTGSAAQVGVQILQAGSVGATTGTPVKLNSAISLGAVGSANAMTVPFVAQFYRLGTLKAGTVSATATVNFTYN